MTAFGGGSIYVLIRVFSSKRSDGLGAASFAWYQHSCQLAAAVGWLLSVPIGHPADTHSIPNSLFQMLDCVNNGILVAWAVSKISVDGCGGIPKLLWFPAIFCYCAGGGTVRDLLLGNPWYGLPFADVTPCLYFGTAGLTNRWVAGNCQEICNWRW
eukprot:SAG31_NODE_3659_length_4015_cov_16.988764_6_plen_156_part_00